MSWEDQGRQYHMWFGNSTAPLKAKSATADAVVNGKSTSERVLALAQGAIAALPAPLRREAEAQYQHGTLPRVTQALTAWISGTALDRMTLASRLSGREADDPVVRLLRSAAVGAATALSREDYQNAAGKLAIAIQTIGIDYWPRFVADASARAGDPATQAVIEKSRQPPDPTRDAIRPV